MTDDTTAIDPLDAGSSDASGLPAQAGEHSVEQNFLALDASDPQTGLPAASPLPVSQADASEVKELLKEAPSLPTAQIPQPPQKAANPEIARMISGIKLPERRVETAAQKAGAAPPRTFDTALGSSLSAPAGAQRAGGQTEKSGVTPEAALDAAPPPLENAPPSGAAEAARGAFSLTGQAGSFSSEGSQLPKEAQREKPALSSLHTLKDDLQSVVRDKKISLVRAAAYEQDKRNRKDNERETAIPRPGQKWIGFIIVSAILLFLSLGSAALYFVYSKAERGENAGPADTSLIFAEKTAPFRVDGLSDIDIKRSLSQARNVSNSLGSIMHIVPMVRAVEADGTVRDTSLSIGEFFTAINARATPELIRSLKGDFFLGIHTTDTNAPLLIIPIVSYERAFAGMLEWEQSLNDDLSPFFRQASLPITDESGLFIESRFEDIVISNYDVRALIGDSGEIQMFYSFPTRNILIIAENPNSFLEILSRLRANRQL